MTWNQLLRAHTTFACTIYPREKIEAIARAAGIEIDDEGDTSAKSLGAVFAYVEAVKAVLGASAAFNAHASIRSKAHELGVELSRSSHTSAQPSQ